MGTTTDRPTLVLGANGKTGRRVAERLEAQGVPVRRASRSGTPAFDWEDPSTWAGALDGMGAVYLSYYPDLSVPGAVETVGAFADLAVRRGVRRIVLLSGRGEIEAEQAEAAVHATGGAVTVVRATWFAQNFSEDYMLEHVMSGAVALPGGDTPEPFVDPHHKAHLAVAPLTHHPHVGEVYELTGPRLLTFAEAVAEISSATGREIAYVPVTVDEHEAFCRQHGVPDEVVELLTYLFTNVFDGRNAHVADGVRRALGREPRDFSEYARAAAASGVWDETPQEVR